MISSRVIVTGEKAVARAFERFADLLPLAVAHADRTVASQAAQDARTAAYSIGGVAAHVAPSISAQGESASISHEIGPAAEFGRDAFAQFAPWTGSGETAGYFLIPSIHRSEGDRAREYEQALEGAMRGL